MKRFEKAVSSLYEAFHNDRLNAFDCCACAVGSIVGHGDWKGYSGYAVGKGIFCKNSDNHHKYPTNSDYTKEELKEIEYHFLKQWSDARSEDGFDKEIQFKGLCAVVEYLCELDGIPNVMDYSSLFEYDEKGATKQLEECGW